MKCNFFYTVIKIFKNHFSFLSLSRFLGLLVGKTSEFFLPKCFGCRCLCILVIYHLTLVEVNLKESSKGLDTVMSG